MKRPRITIARLMLAAGVIGVLIGVPLRWAMWLKVNPFPVSGSIQVRLRAPPGGVVAGQVVPVDVGYDFEISDRRPPAGIFFRIRIDTTVVDRTTGAVVNRYTFYRHVVAGARSKTTGAVRIQLRHPRAGSYYFKYKMGYREPFGAWKAIGSGASGYSVRTPQPERKPDAHQERL